MPNYLLSYRFVIDVYLNEYSVYTNNVMKETLGQVLMKIRETLGLSRKDVQNLSAEEFTKETIRLYEKGQRNISVARLIKLCDFYGVDIRDVLSPDASEIISLRGLEPEDKKLLKNAAARFRRKTDSEEKPDTS